MTKEEQKQIQALEIEHAKYEQKIQELKNKLYVDGKYEWIREFDIEYPVYQYNKSLSTKEINELERRLRSLYYARNTVSHKISNLIFWNNIN